MLDRLRDCLFRYEHLKEAEQLFNTLFSQAAAPMCITRLDGSFIRVNQAFADMLGYSTEQLEQLTAYDVTHQNDISTTHDLLERARQGEISQAQFEKQYITRDGSLRDCLLTSTRIDDKDYIITHIFDITERKEAEETIYHLAYYDMLTGLPNRIHFTEYVERLLELARSNDKPLTVLLVDLDTFKHMNDFYGHEFGDHVLQACSEKFAELTGELCYSGQDSKCSCFCARLGGDEFVFVCQHASNAIEAENVAQRLQQKFSKPLQVDQQQIQMTLSVGIALFPYDGSTVTSLLRAADLALYKAKEMGSGNYCFHETSQSTRVEQYLEHKRALRYFIETNDFQLHYQPLVSVADGSIIGAEVLFRGDQNKYIELDIGRLIEVAEDTGLIGELGRMIMCKACARCKYIRQHYNPNFTIAVNVSARQLRGDNFIQDVESTLEHYQLPERALEIEITETAFFGDFEAGANRLQYLRDLGVGISIDDFGQGYSSMTYIRQLPATALKIDKEFIDEIATDKKAKEIVKGLSRMASTLNLRSCAEGVETEDQFKVLYDIGVDVAQGFLFSKPLPADQLYTLLEE